MSDHEVKEGMGAGVQQGLGQGSTSTSLPPLAEPWSMPQMVSGPLGNVLVVPDGFDATLPAHAMTQSEYRERLGLYDRISSGKSQIQFDTSGFFNEPAPPESSLAHGPPISPLQNPRGFLEAIAKAALFQQQYMGYMADLMNTPTGYKLLSSLDASKFTTKITGGDGGGNGTVDRQAPPTGTDVDLDPTIDTFEDNCQLDENDQRVRRKAGNPGTTEAWMTERPKYAFYHELVHSYHSMRGDAPPGPGGHMCGDPNFEVSNKELQTAGIGPFVRDDITENKIRYEMQKEIRPDYSGSHYGD
jgi:hypothetical protein